VFNMPFVMKPDHRRSIRVFDYVTGREIRLDRFERRGNPDRQELVADGSAVRGDGERPIRAGQVPRRHGGFVFGYVNVAYSGTVPTRAMSSPARKRGLEKSFAPASPDVHIEVAHGAEAGSRQTASLTRRSGTSASKRIFTLARERGVKSICKLLTGKTCRHLRAAATWAPGSVRDILFRTDYKGITTDFVTRRTYVNAPSGRRRRASPSSVRTRICGSC